MRIEEAHDGALNVFVRQSWLKDATICNERGRRGIVHGWNVPNELTAIGTAVHAGAEHKLTTPTSTFADALAAAQSTFTDILAEPMRWVKYNEMQSRNFINDLVHAWYEDLQPQIEGDIIGVEQKFTYLLDRWHDPIKGCEIRLYAEGTIDLVTSTQMWDWKTASRKYSVKEKQQGDIQSTIYAGAAWSLGWREPNEQIDFKFGVIVRDSAAVQVVNVERTPAHLDWVRRMSAPLVRQALHIGMEQEWSMNDSGFLCNETWCPFWAVCRGVYPT